MAVVSIERRGDVALVWVDNPPVNALSHAVRQGLMDAVARTDEDEGIRAVVLVCRGRTFIAGADVREFDQPPREPGLPDVIGAVERAGKPWLAAIHGSALGGGLELALGCRWRLADPSARLGLPEVNLGLIPGAGGTVRLPRLVSAEDALALVTSGKPVTAAHAQKIGLIDALAEGDLADAAVAYARGAADGPLPAALLDCPAHQPADADAWLQQHDAIARRARGQNAPVAAAGAVRDALVLPTEEALARERQTFLDLKADPQSRALRYIFFAERSATRMERLKGVRPPELARIGVIGGGTMGAGIAAACLLAGLHVTLIERDAAAADAGRARISGILADSARRGLITGERQQALLAGLATDTDYGALGRADLVIEAVFEDMETKRRVFAALDAATPPQAVLATNTSYLDITRIAEAVADPGRVIGLHFFSPAHVMKLLEVIHTRRASDASLAAGFALGKRLGKLCVPAGVCDGFIGNRIMAAYRQECEFMLEEGALPEQIDHAMMGFGYAMGIFAVQDLSGLDIAWAMRKRRAASRAPGSRYVEIPDRLCEAGRLGRKAGRGWYDYSSGKAVVDPQVTALIEAESARKGIPRQHLSDDQIMARILGAMQREGRAVIDEGIAASPEAVDVVMVNGFGFPRWRGGPMFMEAQADAGAPASERAGTG